jgi:L-ascorbate metabolism protein UlaG (beta-lactamase superfamily)
MGVISSKRGNKTRTLTLDRGRGAKSTMVLKLYPHSWLLIERGQRRVYVDPAYLEHFFAGDARRIEYSRGPAGVDGLPEPLEKGDLILITHGDADHMNPLTIDRLRDEQTQVFAPRVCAHRLGAFVSPVSEGDELSLGDIGIEVVPAYNTPEGRSTNKHHVRGESVGYVIDIGGRRIYHAGDTDLIPEMSRLERVDVALLPIGGTYTMDLDEAVEAALAIEPELAIPMHTRMEADPKEFVRRLKERNAGIRAIAPETGQPIELTKRSGISSYGG